MRSKRFAWSLIVILMALVTSMLAYAQIKLNSPSEVWGYRVVATYPHDVGAFTQGLVVVDDSMYEGTGGNGGSTLRRVAWATGEIESQVPLSSKYFGEGITILGDRLYQLTWQNRLGLVYDVATFKLIKTFSYAGEGWGLTHDGRSLIMSDGTSTLRFLDPVDFKVQKRLTVKQGRQKISELNELEYVDGEIWANIWHDDRIVRISPEDGRVLGWINLAGLFPRGPQDAERVLNGIAYDRKTRRIFVTGKNWPNLFEIEIVRP